MTHPWEGHDDCIHITVATGCDFCLTDGCVYIEPVEWLSALGLDVKGTNTIVAFHALATRAFACLPSCSIRGYVWLKPGLLPKARKTVPPSRANLRQYLKGGEL
jgi:hypothetical protein